MSSGDNNRGPWGNLGGNKPQKPSNQQGGGSNNNNNNKKPGFDFESMFKKPAGGAPTPEINIGVNGILLIALLLVAGWLMTGFYMIDAAEEGTVLRFGKYHRTATEGLRYHIPSPIEKVYVVKKNCHKFNSNRLSFFNESGAGSYCTWNKKSVVQSGINFS